MQQVEWYGNPRGYNITYNEVRTNESKSICIDDHTANSYVLENMEEFAVYEIVMNAFNDVGSSTSSPKAVERTRESGYYIYIFNDFFLEIIENFCMF